MSIVIGAFVLCAIATLAVASIELIGSVMFGTGRKW